MLGLRIFLFMSFLYGFTLMAGLVCLPMLIAPRSWNVGLVRWWCGVVLCVLRAVVR